MLHERVVEDGAPVAQLEVVQPAPGFVARRVQCGTLQQSARGADAAQAVPVAHRHQRLLSVTKIFIGIHEHYTRTRTRTRTRTEAGSKAIRLEPKPMIRIENVPINPALCGTHVADASQFYCARIK